jgi:hypothetical protein
MEEVRLSRGHASLIIVALLFSLLVTAALPFTQVSKAYSTELTGQEKALSFLRDVVGLDMTKYSVTLLGNGTEYPSELGGLSEESLNFELTYANESQLGAIFLIRNGTLSYYKLYVFKGSALYAQPLSGSNLDTSKDILQRYQNYIGTAQYLQSMKDMLNTLTELQNMTSSLGNIKFEASVTGDSAQLTWSDSPNGIYNAGKSVSLRISNGHLTGFWDRWNLYRIGSSSVNVSREEAISIARERAKNYQLFMNVGGLSNGTLVSVPFNILTYPVNTSLSMVAREPLTLYPFWQVWLWFDKPVHNTYGLAVSMWADTGEFVRISQVGTYGSTGETSTAPSDSSSSPSSSSSSPTQSSTSPAESPNEAPSTTPPKEQATPTEGTTTPASTYIIAAVAAAIIIPIAIVAIAIKKRRK